MFSKNLFRIIVLSIGTLALVGCGRPAKTKSSTVVFPTVTPTFSPNPTIPPVSLVDGSGNNAQSGTATQPPTSGPLVQPAPGLNGMTPWAYLNQYAQAQSNDIRAMAYTGQVYNFGFQLASDAVGTYQIQLPAGVAQEAGANCTSALVGQIANGQPVRMCIRFTQASSGQIQPIRIMVQGTSSMYGAFNVSQNIWVVVLPGQADQYQYVVANGGAIPPVVNRLFVEKDFTNANSSRQTINSSFTVQMLKNGQAAAIYNSQYTIEPANAGRIVQAFGGQVQIEAFVGGKITLIGRGVDQAGQQLEVRGQIAIPRQVSLKYTERSKVCIDSSDKAVLYCMNNSGNTYSLSVQAANGFNTPATIAPGAYNQMIVNLPAQKDTNGRWYANYTITVDGNQPNGAIVCEAVVLNSRGADEQRFIVPGL